MNDKHPDNSPQYKDSEQSKLTKHASEEHGANRFLGEFGERVQSQPCVHNLDNRGDNGNCIGKSKAIVSQTGIKVLKCEIEVEDIDLHKFSDGLIMRL